MLGLIGKCDDFGLDRRTVTRPDTLNLAIVERRFGQPLAQDIMGFLTCKNVVAAALTQFALYLRQIGEMVKILL